MSISKRALIIGNCQVKSLAETLNLFVEDVDFDHLQVHGIATSKLETELAKRAREAHGRYDFVLSFELGPKFHSMSRERIGDTFVGKQVLFISNLWFDGYFPDIVTLGDIKSRLDGPLAQYRSRIALFGFMSGWSIDRTISAFSESTYEAAGYFANWSSALERLVAADETVDIPFGRDLASLVAQAPAMYVVNHPTPRVFHKWAGKVVDELSSMGIAKRRTWTPSEAMVPAHFSTSAVFPIYPEIAARSGLEFPGSYYFKAPGVSADSILTLPEFVTREYAGFASIGKERLAAEPRWSNVQEKLTPILA